METRLPEDPFMLLSFVNMKLRDGNYKDLTDFCDSNGYDKHILSQKLHSAGFDYLPDINQFR